MCYAVKEMCEAKEQTWEERLIEEFGTLCRRIESLERLLEKFGSGELTAQGIRTPKDVFEMQLRAMKDYRTVLESRLLIEGIYGKR